MRFTQLAVQIYRLSLYLYQVAEPNKVTLPSVTEQVCSVAMGAAFSALQTGRSIEVCVCVSVCLCLCNIEWAKVDCVTCAKGRSA